MNDATLQAVIFDLDDTLFAERDYVRSGYRAVAARLADDPAGTEIIAAWMWERFREGRTERMFNAAAEHFGLDVEIAELVTVYREHAPAIAPLPEAVEVIAALRGRVKLGLLSDGFLPAQQIKFDALGLTDAFDAVCFTEAMGRACWKPSTAGFERLAAEMGVDHAACAYVGDNATKDFVAPNALGWLSILWRRDGQVYLGAAPPAGGAPRITVSTGAALLAALEPHLP